ncbi:MAG: hypothetical protein IPP34_16700 [Bacteroidetes bacterium]|nr:hypothetical protein [Bacteroidota bacterium]
MDVNNDGIYNILMGITLHLILQVQFLIHLINCVVTKVCGLFSMMFAMLKHRPGLLLWVWRSKSEAFAFISPDPAINNTTFIDIKLLIIQYCVE